MQGWGNNGVWKRFHGPRHAANFGIGGDRTQHVFWRIENGEIDGIHPRVAVLMIGTNNVGSNSADEIAAGVTAIVHELRKRLPETKVLLLGVFPRGARPDATRKKLGEVNRQICRLDDGTNVSYLDIGKTFLNPDRTISREIMPDYLHLTAGATASGPMPWSRPSGGSLMNPERKTEWPGLGTGSGIEEIRCLQPGQIGPHCGLVGKRMAGGLSWAARLQAQDGPGEPEVLLRRELEIER